MTAEERQRDEPRISVTKLGEYMVASASRRRSIVRDQKRPRDVIVARYTEVYPVIAGYLSDGGQMPEAVEAAIQRLYDAPATTEWQEQNNKLSAEALENFLELSDTLDLSSFSVSLRPDDPPKLATEGVSISVRPELGLTQANARDRIEGAVKLYISKNNALGDDAGAYVATTVHQYLSEVIAANTSVDTRACFVIDVFAQRVYTAPRAYRRRRADIAAACQEIVRAWDVL
ncbi:MAG: hypothetical protein ACREM3_18820 [Candidatus Rokuibacteriota bacterium]